MIDRRLLLTGLAATAVLPGALAHGLLTHESEQQAFMRVAMDFAHRHPEVKRLSYRPVGLDRAWALTKGKTPQDMHRALTKAFGPFPQWFVDDQGEVVILGVGNYSDEILERHHPYILRGHMLCDVRIIRMVQNGRMEECDTVERPPRFDCGYVT